MGFDTRLVLMRPKAGRDALGQPLKGYDDVDEIWADVRSPNGLASLSADARTSVAKVSVRIRRRTDVAAGWGLRDGATVYKVLVPLPNTTDRVNLDLVCEVVA